MGSLTKCLTEVAPSQADRDALTARTKELVTLGETPVDAGLMAAQEVMGEAQTEFDDVVAQLPAEPAVMEQATTLDMSKEARMKRAEEMGFDTSTVYYHGTGAEFTAFDESEVGAGGATPVDRGFFFDADYDAAAQYGKYNVLENYLKLGKSLKIDAGDNNTHGYFDYSNESILQEYDEGGYDSIVVVNQSGDKMVVVFEPSQIRSVDATFDPAFKESGQLLAQKVPTSKEARGYYDIENTTIRLTEAANLSTFIHEFAHFMYEMELKTDGDTLDSIQNWYKRNALEVAADATAEDGTTTEADVITFIDEGTTGNKEKDVAIHRAVHEQFARGFEKYLMEGKAPSIELRNAFRTFARWLTEIYARVRGGLRVNLDDDARQVFDRMLATEEQIAAAEVRARIEPMFTDAAMAGMTEKEFVDYQKRAVKPVEKATETLRDKLIKELTRQKETWWKVEKQDIFEEELARLKGEQVYSTQERLRTGDMKLDHATVKEMVGEIQVDKLGRKSKRIPTALRGTTAKGQEGVHPDEAAAFFGYNSGSEMLTDLINAPKITIVAEANAEAEMKRIHGDILNDGTIEREADDAVQNEERGRLLLHELKVLSRGTNQRAIDRQAVKSMAEDNIGRLSYRQIFPAKYRRAEIKAAQESATALVAGDKDTAASAKARQVMNYYLGMAATNAKNETIKIVDNTARYRKKRIREEIQKAGNEYWEQLVKILGRFEFRKSATLKGVEGATDINTWMKNQNENEGDGLTLAPVVLTNEGQIQHWKNVPFSELQGVDESIRNIEHVARYSNKIDLLEEKVTFQKAVSDWVDHMDKASPNRFEVQRTTTLEKKNWIRSGMAQMTKIPWMASWLDGGERVGMSHDLLVQKLNEAYAKEHQIWKQTGDPVIEALNNRSKEDQQRHLEMVYIPEIKTDVHDGNLTGAQILSVALNTGNAGNLRKMLLGEGWANPESEATININNPQLQAVLSHMTGSDWLLVQTIWDQMEELYPALAEVHRRTTGLVPPKVESTPVETKFGTFKGGYYPVVYDRFRSARADQLQDRADAQLESMFGGALSLQAAVNTGATQERTGYYAPINLNMDVVPNHFNDTIHYIAFHDAVRQINKLIRNQDVKDTIIRKLGREEYNQLPLWLNDVAKDGRAAPPKTFIDAAFNQLRLGVTLGVMGFKASTGIIQLSGIFNTMAEVGQKDTYSAMRTVYGKGIRSLKDAQTFAFEHSNIMETRTKTMDREIKSALDSLGKKKGVIPALQEASMKHIAFIQFFGADLISWHAAYTKRLGETGDTDKAARYADWVVDNVQGSGATRNMATVFRNQGKVHTTFTMFMTFFSSLWNAERDVVKGARAGTYSMTTVAAKLMFMFTLPVLFEMLMRGEIDPDDEEESIQKTLTNLALFPVSSVPFVRDLASGTLSGYGYTSTPVAGVIEQGLAGLVGVGNAVMDDDEITASQAKRVTKLIGAAAGVPGVNQAWATGEHLYDVIEEGEDFSAHSFLFGPKKD